MVGEHERSGGAYGVDGQGHGDDAQETADCGGGGHGGSMDHQHLPPPPLSSRIRLLSLVVKSNDVESFSILRTKDKDNVRINSPRSKKMEHTRDILVIIMSIVGAEI
ncbi:hypothetical protein Salat_1760000 [Sesamum alatum]|uniref:Uncharacterized protein n=1 Tax=Sesamum alatum TaxID=300844 RepID=A0AAE2CKM2_9LAMI|nr:hypothetical protein Salat_1760000 [Sesamum alatum]